MAGKKPPVGNVEPRLGGLRVQTSLYGQTIPVVYGRARVPGNLVWYGNFKATAQEERSEAAKGGGSKPTRTYYAYSASVAMLLAEGPIVAVRTLYKGKQAFYGETISTLAGTQSISATVPTTPFQITVPTPSAWSTDLGVSVQPTDYTSWPAYNQTLINGVDYTVAAGVYTFASGYAGRMANISYTTSATSSSTDALGQLGLSLANGAPGQAVWQHLASDFPTEAIPYSGLAYVRGRDYALSSAAEVENHGFEVDGFLGFYASGDARPSDVIRDMLTNGRYGVGWGSLNVGDWTAYTAYCDAYGLKVSPAFLEQRPAREWISDMLEATNTDAAWNGSQLRLIPRGDENAGSYTAPITPVFDLGADDFLSSDGAMPLRLVRSSVTDAHNTVRVEYANRGADPSRPGYNLETVTAEDDAAIVTFGRRAESAQTWHFFCDATAARQAANLRLQRKLAVRNRWSGTLPWRFVELEPGDLVTLTDANHRLSKWPVRVVSIEETGDDFACEFEDFPIGHATAPIVAPQVGSGFRPDFNADPGNVAAPLFIEPPGGYTSSGLEVWAAVSGQAGATGQFWGGAEVYASLDGGASYKLVGRVDQGARYGTLAGTLSTGAAATLDVQLAGRGGQLRSVSAPEADALTTLCFVGTPASGEFLAFQTATLAGTNRYRLTVLRRGQYGTDKRDAAIGDTFLYLDGALAMSGPLPPEMIGQTIKFKFCSFNCFGGGLQSLASVTEYSYVLTGRFREQAVQNSSWNLLSNANLDVNAATWTTLPQNLAAGTAVGVQVHPFDRVPGTPGSAYLSAQSGLSGDSPGMLAISAPFSVTPGDAMVGFADLIGYATNAYVGLSWYDGADNWLQRVDYSNVVTGGFAGSSAWREPARYERARTRGTVPTGAALGRLVIYGQGGWSAATPNKYVSFHRPFAGVVKPGVFDDPAWNAGGLTVVDTDLIAQGAINRKRVVNLGSPVALATTAGETALLSVLLAELPIEDGDWVVWTVTGVLTVAGSATARIAAKPVYYTFAGKPVIDTTYFYVSPGTQQPVYLDGEFQYIAGSKGNPIQVGIYGACEGGAATLLSAKLRVEITKR